MATAKKNLGKMPCPCCGGPVAVKQAETGTLSYTCQEADCEATGYAPAHTSAARKWLKALGVADAPPAAPKAPPAAPKAAPKAEAPPAPKAPPRPAFSIAGL